MLALLITHLATVHGALDAAVQTLPVLHALTPTVMSSSNDSGGGAEVALLISGPVTGTAIYAAVYRYYRNADKTHQFETETLIALKTAITGKDQKVDEVLGTRRALIEGDNRKDFRERVGTLE